MMSSATILLAFMAVAFCVGVAVFYRLRARRTARAAGMGWLVCAAIVLILGWSTFLLDMAPRAAVFTGLILPVWLMGGLVGLVAGLVRHRNSAP